MFFSKKKKPQQNKRERTHLPVKGGNRKAEDSLDIFSTFRESAADNDSDLEAELEAISGKKLAPSGLDLIETTGNDDEDIEAELAFLIGNKNKKTTVEPTKQDFCTAFDFDAEVENEADEDVDENDPELLGELADLMIVETEPVEEIEEDVKCEEEEVSQVTTLKERLEMYKNAASLAISNNDQSRARRFNRGIKTLEKQLEQAITGVFISPKEIPPEVATNLKKGESNILQEDNTDPTPVVDSSENLKLEPSQVDILKNRLEMYKKAEEVARSNNEVSRIRRLSRGIKTLENQLKQAQSGKSIQTDEIPPEVVIDIKKLNDRIDNSNQEQPNEATEIPTTEPDVEQSEQVPVIDPVEQPEVPSQPIEIENPILTLLKSRREECKALALEHKRSNRMPEALNQVKVIKMLDELIKKVQSGETVDLSEVTEKQQETIKQTSVVEELQQRLEYFQLRQQEAEALGKRTDARKLREIVTLYKGGIRNYNRNMTVQMSKLPLPPYKFH